MDGSAAPEAEALTPRPVLALATSGAGANRGRR